MKKWTRWALALALCLALAVTVALAEEAPITVQLDGQALTFTDAVPQVKDQRTFLPFRAVFEAMGAEVDYEGSVITASRGDKSLTMTLDQTTASVTEQGKTTTITMDVAPYVDPATWRTYVPVRFAAQAFDCVVGWDQEAQTAIIVDTDKLLAAATEGKSFTYLEKMMAYSEKYNGGIWDANASFDADMSIMAMPMTISGTVRGTVQDGDKMALDMNMKVDMDALVQQSIGDTPTPALVQAMLNTLKTKGMDLSMRGHLALGKFYMNMDLRGMVSGVDPNTWYQMDMAAMMAQMGMDWTELMAQSEGVDMLSWIKTFAASSEPTDAATAYGSIKDTLEQALTALADQSFVKEALEEGDEYTTILDLTQDNVTATVALVLGMKDDALTAYSMGMSMAFGEDDSAFTVDVVVSMDDEDQMYAEIGMDAAGLVTLDMTMEGAYTPGTTAPVVTPPAGANVVDFMELAGGSVSSSNGPAISLPSVIA